jgi:hypothetical protein
MERAGVRVPNARLCLPDAGRAQTRTTASAQSVTGERRARQGAQDAPYFGCEDDPALLGSGGRAVPWCGNRQCRIPQPPCEALAGSMIVALVDVIEAAQPWQITRRNESRPEPSYLDCASASGSDETVGQVRLPRRRPRFRGIPAGSQSRSPLGTPFWHRKPSQPSVSRVERLRLSSVSDLGSCIDTTEANRRRTVSKMCAGVRDSRPPDGRPGGRSGAAHAPSCHFPEVAAHPTGADHVRRSEVAVSAAQRSTRSSGLAYCQSTVARVHAASRGALNRTRDRGSDHSG